MDRAYAFGDERDLDTALDVVRDYRNFSTIPVQLETDAEQIIFAKVDSGQSGKDVTATQVVWNATTKEFEAPEGTALKFDTANKSNEYTTTNLQSTTDLSADDVVEVIFYPDKSETEQWLARPGGDAPPMAVVRLVSSVSTTEYNGYVQSSSDPATRTDGASLVTCKVILSSMGGFLETGSDAYFPAYEEGGVYWIANIAVFK